MPIASTDLVYQFSVPTATQGNQTLGNAATSHGGWLSTTLITDAVLDNIFSDVTGDENASSNVDYKCIFLVNNHATLTLQRAVVWLFSEVVGGANGAVALDNIGILPKASNAQQATIITGKNVAPVGVTTFSTATTKSAGLTIGDIPPGNCAAIWLRRTATNSVAQVNDGVSIRAEGDTSQ